jgi:hypothetical protein
MGHISTNCKNKGEDNSIKNKKLEGKKIFLRNTIRRKMTRHVMLSGIQMKV